MLQHHTFLAQFVCIIPFHQLIRFKTPQIILPGFGQQGIKKDLQLFKLKVDTDMGKYTEQIKYVHIYYNVPFLSENKSFFSLHVPTLRALRTFWEFFWLNAITRLYAC